MILEDYSNITILEAMDGEELLDIYKNHIKEGKSIDFIISD